MMDWVAEHGSIVVLVTFFTMFLGFALWAYVPTNKQKMTDYGKIPLKETGNGNE